MEKITLTNGCLTAEIDALGAELRSLKDREGREYMWQADPMFWARTSPVLFPVVGSFQDKRYVYDGNVYEMSQHGFARDMTFSCDRADEQCAWFSIKETPETLKKYPFRFQLSIGYELRDAQLKVLWRVENTDDKELFFSIGAHPAFNCDLDTDSLIFYGTDSDVLVSNVIAQDGSGCLSDERRELRTQKGVLRMSDELFSRDALIIEGRQANAVGLLDGGAKEFLRVEFEAPLFGVWSPVNKHAPFVCIEPWYGRCDRQSFSGELSEREYGNALKSGEIFDAAYRIEII